jgi:hypothetical protein
MKNALRLFTIVLSISSCATIFNKKYQTIDIYTNKPVNLEINQDTIPYAVNHHEVNVERGRENLDIKLFNDSTEKDVVIPSQLGISYWFNFYSPYLTGFLIDLTNPKRFVYPKTLYINMNSLDNDYLTYLPWEPGTRMSGISTG